MLNLQCGDAIKLMGELEPNSIDMILTDPPYPLKWQHLYGDMAKEAARILKVGGNLVTLLGHYQVPAVTEAMGKHLRYWWIGGMQHDTLYRMPGKWVCIRWKPCLWYVKERRVKGDYECPMDLFYGGGKDKRYHKWGQGVGWFEHWGRLCPKDGTILDPFLGGGTVGIAALNLKRRFIGFEIEETTFKIAEERINDYRKEIDA